MTPSPPADEAGRLAVLRSLEVLDSPPEAAFDALVASASRITGCSVALISLVDENRLWFKARVGLDVASTARHPSFCTNAILGDELLEVPDLAADARFCDNPLVTGEPHMRFYAGQPLQVLGQRIGTLCVMDQQPRTLSPEDRALLVQLSRAATELLLSRQRLREAVHERRRLLDFGRAGGDWMWESDAQHRYLWLSESFESMTGLSAEAQVGRPISDTDVVNAEGVPVQPPMAYRELLARHAPFARVVTRKLTSDRPLYLSRSAVPKLDEAGRFDGYRGTIRNVTGQVLATQRLLERDALLAKLSSQIPGVIFQYQLHPDGRTAFTYASPRTREIFGPAPPGGTGSDPSVPFRMLHPDDREGFMASLAESARSLQPLMREYRIVRDGSVRWLDIFSTPERLADGSTLWHGFTADITERRETEMALRRREAQWELAASAAGIGLAWMALDDGVVHLDALACANHGLPFPSPRLTLTDWMDSIEPDDRPTATAGAHQVLSDGTHFEGRYRVRRPDGQVRWLEFVIRATRDAGHRIDGLTGICRDVHDQQTTAHIERARQEAERSSRAKSQFLSRVSHELRTPLNGILGFAQLMARDPAHPLPPSQSQRLESLQRAGAHLLNLIDDVLEISRTEAGENPVQLAPVALGPALEAALALMQPLAQERQIALHRTIDHAARAAGGGDTPDAAVEWLSIDSAWAWAEPQRVQKVLRKLLSNAIKFSPPGSRVGVQGLRHRDQVGIAVRDDGPGLDADQRARLFQPFDRLGAERLHVEGIGLGLFISRQLAEAMGGRIAVQSERGAGSTFTLWLASASGPSADASGERLGQDARPAPAATEAVEVRREAAFATVSAVRQLVYVEDESLNQLLLQEMLRSRPQWQLHIAADGATGLRLARELQPDLMLIDINLPDITGLTLVRALRSDPATRQLRCIALSADATREQIDAALTAGFSDYWTKPLNVSRVLAAFEVLLK